MKLDSNSTVIATQLLSNEVWFKYTLCTTLLIVLILGVLANSIVCTAICTRRQRKRSIHYLILNLTVTEIFILLLYVPSVAYQVTAFELNEIVYIIVCRIRHVIYVVTVNVKLTTLLIITAER